MADSRTYLSIIVAGFLAACGEDAPVPPNDRSVAVPQDWSEQQRRAYDKCLRDNMAVATAWEMIEAGCRTEVEGAAEPRAGLSVEDN